MPLTTHGPQIQCESLWAHSYVHSKFMHNKNILLFIQPYLKGSLHKQATVLKQGLNRWLAAAECQEDLQVHNSRAHQAGNANVSCAIWSGDELARKSCSPLQQVCRLLVPAQCPGSVGQLL